MRKRLTACLVLAVMLVSVFATAVFADNKVNLQIYFAPQIMNDQTGEIIVDVNIRNFKTAVSKNVGDICGFSFKFDYDTENFDLKTNDDGSVSILGDDKAMVKNLADVEAKAEGSRVSIAYLDSSLKDNMISGDGTAFSFTLVSKNPKSLWNSFDTYPIRFVPGSVGAAAYRLSDYKVSGIYNIEAVDGKVGGYNVAPTFAEPKIDKTLKFSLDSNTVEVNGEEIATDAAAFKLNGETMLPVRYFAENADMTVEWDGEKLVASAYGEYRTLTVALDKDGKSKTYFNAAEVVLDNQPVEKDGRIYIPLTLVKTIFGKAEITETETETVIVLP